MKNELKSAIAEVSGQIASISEAIVADSPCRAFVALRMCDDGRSVKISGNSEGLMYLASILTGLAADAKIGQHFHFGEGEMLDEAERDLILQFEPAEWDDSTEPQANQ